MSRVDRFLGDEVARPAPEGARFAILPVPYERTVSWQGGTAKGPQAILDASPYLEFWDEQLDLEPWRDGIWTDRPLSLPGTDPQEAVRAIERRFGELLDAGHFVLMLGGEHGVTPGGVAATAARREGLQLVQLDAHADLRQAYEGEPWSHACAMARSVDRVAGLRAVGLRAYTPEEAAWMAANTDRYRAVHAWETDRPGWQDRILEGLEGQPVYLTFDVDYFDPSIVPATGTPEPGGGDWHGTMAFLDRLFAMADVVAADIVELAPRPGLHHADFAAARLAHKILCWRARADRAAGGRS